jgi:MFS family permease
VERWGFAKDRVGLGVGMLASAFFLAQLVTVVHWGKAADRWGRRPVLLVGLVGTGITMAAFGFAESFWVALLMRALTGALNGNVAIAKVYVGECSDSSNIARAFSYLSFTWGLGVISAPALGGFLASPVEQYPETFGDNALLKRYPYLLPSLVSACWAWLSLLLGYFMLPETDVFLQRQVEAAEHHGRGSERGADIELAPAHRAPGEEISASEQPASRRGSDLGLLEDSEPSDCARLVPMIVPTRDSAAVVRAPSVFDDDDDRSIEQDEGIAELAGRGSSQVSAAASGPAALGNNHASDAVADQDRLNARHSKAVCVSDAPRKPGHARRGNASSGNLITPAAASSRSVGVVGVLKRVTPAHLSGICAGDTGSQCSAWVSQPSTTSDAQSAQSPGADGANEAKRHSAVCFHAVSGGDAESRSSDTDDESLQTSPASGDNDCGASIDKGAAARVRHEAENAGRWPPLPEGASVSLVLRDAAVRSSIVAYGLLSCAQILFDELMPVFCKLEAADGGLGFTSAQVGSVQIVAGVTQITSQLFIFPALSRRFGPLKCFRHSMWPLACLAAFPIAGRFAGDAALTWTALSAAIVWKTVLMAICFTTIMIAINNSTQGRNLGMVTGLSQAVASAVRCTLPTIGGALFSFSIDWRVLGSWRLHVVYVLIAACTIAGYLASFTIPRWVNWPPQYVEPARPGVEMCNSPADCDGERSAGRKAHLTSAVCTGSPGRCAAESVGDDGGFAQPELAEA